MFRFLLNTGGDVAAVSPDAADSADTAERESMSATNFCRCSFLKRHWHSFNLFADGLPSKSRKRWIYIFSLQGQPAASSCESRRATSLIHCKSSSESSIALSYRGKGHQHKAEQIDMADATGSEHNRFGMSVNQSADVHTSGVLSKTLIISSKLATIF